MKILLFFLLISPLSFAQTEAGSLQGTVVDHDGQFLPLVRVSVYTSGTDFREIRAGVETDFDGNFRIVGLAPGRYDIELKDVAFSMDTFRLTGIDIHPEQITSLGTVELEMKDQEFSWCCCITLPVVQLDPFGRSITINKEDIRRN